jgi:colicin import membrane protein
MDEKELIKNTGKTANLYFSTVKNEEKPYNLWREFDKDLAKDTRIAIEGQEDLVAGSNSGELEKYKALIQQKIYQNVNKQLCGLDPVELTFEITLMPTGDLIGDAKMIKSSKIESCDLAVERAILQAQPLPLPKDNRLFSQLKKLKLKFQPNGNVD